MPSVDTPCVRPDVEEAIDIHARGLMQPGMRQRMAAGSKTSGACAQALAGDPLRLVATLPLVQGIIPTYSAYW